MNINPNWRILTIGDGDLSFSASLLANHQPRSLTATVFDSQAALEQKYGLKYLDCLRDGGVDVITEFDVTQAQSWQNLTGQAFDLVIFQFPLIPNSSSSAQFKQRAQWGDPNLQNRRLLHLYLKHAQQYFLCPKGERLAVITSKDVKPYRQWNIEQSLTHALQMRYVGQQPFDFEQFPGYQIRNVDRDKFVKQTQGISYFYTDKLNHPYADNLTLPEYIANANQAYCAMCRVGPMLTPTDKLAHLASKRHQTMLQFEQNWQAYLSRP